jgi:hypothetical protein
MKKYYYLIIFGLLSFSGFSQEKKWTTYLGMNYLNNYVYNGRSDSLNLPYIIPSITLENENGLTLNSDLYYFFDGKNNGFDFLELNAEYEFDIFKNASGSVNGTKFFSNGKSDSFIGNLSYTLGGNLSYDFKWFEFSTSADVLKGPGTMDIRLSPGIERTFSWEKGSRYFELNPSVYAVFSTLNYFESYSNTRKLNRARNGGPARGATISTNTLVQNPGLTLMAFELSFPLTYETNRFGMSIIPTYALPKNPIITNEITSSTVAGRGTILSNVVDIPYTERYLNPIFFWQINFYLKF